MLKLYTYQECPYCGRVRDAFEDMGVEYEEIDAMYGTPGSEELVSLGGKQQVPFLVDEEEDVQMYESMDIINYVKEKNES